MNIHQLHILSGRLTLAVMFSGLLYINLSAQTNSRTLNDLAKGDNKIFLCDRQSIIPIQFDPLPGNSQITEMGSAIHSNWVFNNISSTKSVLTLQLITNEDTIQPSPAKKIKKLSIRVKYLKTNGNLDSSLSGIDLQTGFDNSASNPYVFYHSVKIDSVVFAFIEVTGIEYDDSTISPLHFDHDIRGRDTLDQISSITPITFIAKLDPIHTYNLTAEAPSNGSSSAACKVSAAPIDITGDIRINWSAANVPPATTYTELEWTFVNTYPDGPPDPNTIFNFRMNNTSVKISSPANQYSLPMIFEKGVLIFRVRWISLRGNDQKPVYSSWSLPESGTIGGIPCGKIEVTNDLIHEGDKKNWQCITTYAEEGKHKAVVTYYDGTMRSRQAVTRLSESNTVIVGETIYDFQGRPAIQVLPVPVGLMDFPAAAPTHHTGIDIAPAPFIQPSWQTARETIILENLGLRGSGSTTSTIPSSPGEMIPDVPEQYLPQKIQYYQNFNLNNAHDSYSWQDFDTGALCDNSMHASSMANTKGASRYYSQNNDDRSGFNAYIPNANGYPFIQTEYTPDNTGRISRQGALGDTFQLRRGHDTRYFYGVPSQDELDRLFGSDAGSAAYYKKNMITDGNGQTAVEYVDMKGKVVASGLAGESPVNLDSLENKWTFRNTMDLFGADVRFQNELNNTLRSTTPLLVEQNNTRVTFQYDLQEKRFLKDFCAGTSLCLDCKYDYNIRVTDECGATRWIASQNRVGASNILNGNCDAHTNIRQDTSIMLNKGVYSVSRTLSVSPDSIERYGLLYDTTMICQQTRDSIMLAGDLNFPRLGCNITCENCKKTISNQANILSMMLNDVSKNGMYGEIYQHIPDDTATHERNEERDIILPFLFHLSVFNTGNQLGDRRNWKYPSKNKFNPGGAKYYERDSTGALVESWVTIPPEGEMGYKVLVPALPPAILRMVNGRMQVRPEALLDVREFIEAWKEEWANALLPYHPEYPSLLWYMRDSLSNAYDERLNNIQTYAEADTFINGITDVNQDAPQILNRDPYFLNISFPGRSSARTRIKDLLFGTRDTAGRHPLEIMALSSAYCAIENMPPAESTECLGARRLYTTQGMKDAEWQFVRALYLEYKHHIQDSLRNSELVLTGTDAQYANEFDTSIEYRNPSLLNMGDSTTRSSGNLYWNKVMRLPTENDIMKNMIGCLQIKRIAGGSTFSVPNIACMQDKAEEMMKTECNKCPLAQKLETLLWLLASTNKLTTNSTAGMIGRIINTPDMITPLGSPDVRRMTWSPIVSGTELLINIQAQDGFSGSGTSYNQSIKLKSFDTAIVWGKLRVIRCLNYTATPELFPLQRGKNFSLRGIDAAGKEFRLEGFSSCYSLDGCKNIRISDPGKQSPNKKQAGSNDKTSESEKYSVCCTPMPPPMSPPINDCEKNRNNLIGFFYNQTLQEKVAQKRIELRKEYTDYCLQNADAFKAILDNSIYQITLFYYDQAGNLIKTVPPAGVDTLNRSQILTVQDNRNHNDTNTTHTIYPHHSLASTYKYNTLNQVIEKTSPDAGIVHLFYDSLGRVHLSQDALQATLTNAGGTRAYSYIIFDKLGRISESGQAYLDSALVASRARSHIAVKNMVNVARRKEEVVHIYYDRQVDSTVNRYFNAGGQQLLRNRVSSTVFTETVDTDASSLFGGTGDVVHYDNATHYSYDYHGNVKTLIQENRDQVLLRRGQSRKRIDYDYDLISGKTNKVCYQCDSADQFIHRYEYDAGNRITEIYSGTRSDRLQRDAQYIFYRHGPLARINLGDRLVQGIDYAYTLQGWLKGINSNTADPENDMGGDGGTGSPYARDRYGFSLNYFTNDYSPIAIRDSAHSFLAGTGSALTTHLAQKGLYNGNIASTATTIKDITGPDALLNLYTYDQLQRIKTSDSYAGLQTNVWGSAVAPTYRTSYAYDPDGNITNLTRSAGGNQFDNLTYTYPLAGNRLQNNKLRTVTENASPRSLPGAGDISENINYAYDQNGNITHENSAILQWTATGRLKQYGDRQRYAYDAAQRRVKKTDGTTTQYYVRDPTGNILALYTFRDDSLFWSGSPIYGASRLGMYHANKQLPSTRPGSMDTLYRGNTEYELTNHLGDVLATVSDKKLIRTERSSTYSSDLLTDQEYFPFGMTMPNRTFLSSSLSAERIAVRLYPFGYNGMEGDKKEGSDGYTTEFRQYDSRIGRWKSMDPKTEKTNSYYDGLENNPIAVNDISGDDPPPAGPAAGANDLPGVANRNEEERQRAISNLTGQQEMLRGLRDAARTTLGNINTQLGQSQSQRIGRASAVELRNRRDQLLRVTASLTRLEGEQYELMTRLSSGFYDKASIERNSREAPRVLNRATTVLSPYIADGPAETQPIAIQSMAQVHAPIARNAYRPIISAIIEGVVPGMVYMINTQINLGTQYESSRMGGVEYAGRTFVNYVTGTLTVSHVIPLQLAEGINNFFPIQQRQRPATRIYSTNY